eukprot:7098529-Prymnesium_polylepis.1
MHPAPPPSRLPTSPPGASVRCAHPTPVPLLHSSATNPQLSGTAKIHVHVHSTFTAAFTQHVLLRLHSKKGELQNWTHSSTSEGGVDMCSSIRST